MLPLGQVETAGRRAACRSRSSSRRDSATRRRCSGCRRSSRPRAPGSTGSRRSPAERPAGQKPAVRAPSEPRRAEARATARRSRSAVAMPAPPSSEVEERRGARGEHRRRHQGPDEARAHARGVDHADRVRVGAPGDLRDHQREERRDREALDPAQHGERPERARAAEEHEDDRRGDEQTQQESPLRDLLGEDRRHQPADRRPPPRRRRSEDLPPRPRRRARRPAPAGRSGGRPP